MSSLSDDERMVRFARRMGVVIVTFSCFAVGGDSARPTLRRVEERRDGLEGATIVSLIWEDHLLS